MFSISFLPWILLILASIIAVPVAIQMSPKPTYAGGSDGDDETGNEETGDEAIPADEEAMVVDDFGADPNSAEDPFGNDAFG